MSKRYYSGINPTGKKISDLLPDLLMQMAPTESEKSGVIFSFWFSLIGEKMGSFTKPVSYANAVLTIKVKSATLYEVLCRHEKKRLLKQLHAKYQVQDIIFRIG